MYTIFSKLVKLIYFRYTLFSVLHNDRKILQNKNKVYIVKYIINILKLSNSLYFITSNNLFEKL